MCVYVGLAKVSNWKSFSFRYRNNYKFPAALRKCLFQSVKLTTRWVGSAAVYLPLSSFICQCWTDIPFPILYFSKLDFFFFRKIIQLLECHICVSMDNAIHDKIHAYFPHVKAHTNSKPYLISNTPFSNNNVCEM